MRDLVSWSDVFERSLQELGQLANDPANLQGASDAEFKRRLRPLSECAKALRREAGPPPTERLARTLEVLQDACGHYRRAAGLLLLAWQGAGGGPEASREAERGRDLLQRAYDMLPPGEAQALPVVGAKSSETKIDPLYGRVAGEIAKQKTEARCWSEADWPRLIQEERVVTGTPVSVNVLGLTGIGSKRINLSPDACGVLDRLAYDGEQPDGFEAKLRLALGIGTLAHEAQHRAGIVKEDVAECYGLQGVREAAVALGADPAYANELADVYWGNYDNISPEYSSPECRDGGRLDLNRATSRWP